MHLSPKEQKVLWDTIQQRIAVLTAHQEKCVKDEQFDAYKALQETIDVLNGIAFKL